MAGLRYGVEIRRAQAGDAVELARLLGQVGVAVTAGQAAERLDAMHAGPDAAVLVTTGYGGLSGVVAVRWGPVLQQPRPVAGITMLVVEAEERRHGLGRMLLKAASQAARMAGCDVLEVSGAGEAGAFYAATGFVGSGSVFVRSLRRRGGVG